MYGVQKMSGHEHSNIFCNLWSSFYDIDIYGLNVVYTIDSLMFAFLQYRYLKYISVRVSEIQYILWMSMGYEHIGNILTYVSP